MRNSDVMADSATRMVLSAYLLLVIDARKPWRRWLLLFERIAVELIPREAHQIRKRLT